MSTNDNPNNQHNTSFNLPTLTRWHKARLLHCAEHVLIAQQQMMTSEGNNILHHTLQKKQKHIRFKHYPKGDRIDSNTGGQYFYHCHREDLASAEHGHFHCFLRQKKIPKHIKPTPLADWDKNLDNPMVHLIAIAMDRLGQPIRLFTVNRWVTDETWYDAQHVALILKRFKMTLQKDLHWKPVDQWVEGMIHLFAPQIVWLHQERDKKINQHQMENPTENSYENKNLEELSEINIDLSSQIHWIINS